MPGDRENQTQGDSLAIRVKCRVRQVAAQVPLNVKSTEFALISQIGSCSCILWLQGLRDSPAALTARLVLAVAAPISREFSRKKGMKWIAASDSGYVPASHEDPRSPGVLKRVIATRDLFQEGHVQMLNWALLPAGSSFQRHYHEDMQEVFLIITGSVRMTVADESRQLGPGDAVLVDPGEIHQMQNLLTTPAEYIVFGITSGRGGRTIVISEPQN